MVVYFECPQCACTCACSDFDVASAASYHHCGRRIEQPRQVFLNAEAGGRGGAAPRGGDTPRHRGKPFPQPFISPPPPLAGRISRHIERAIGPCPMVFHHALAPDAPLDIHVSPPRKGRHSAGSAPIPCFTLVTSGLSSHRLHPPRSAHAATASPYAELMISLPANWPGLRPDGMFEHDAIRRPENAWPLEWLKTIAALSIERKVLPTPAVFRAPKLALPAPGTAYTGVMLLASVLHPKASPLVVHDDSSVAIYALWPVYPEEILLARRACGIAELSARLAAEGIPDLVHPARKNVAG